MTVEPRERAVGAAGVAVAAAALLWAAGPAGAAAAGLLALAWYRLPAAYAFALGQVVAAAVLGDAALAAVAGVEAGLLAVLVAPLSTLNARAGAAFVAATAGLSAVAWAALRAWEPLWAAAVALAVVAATAAYALHRVERVRLGLVEGSP